MNELCENYIEEYGKVPLKGEYDVIVAGSGVAGVAAPYQLREWVKKYCLLKKVLRSAGLLHWVL